jgi:predicted alpha/beta superfamily hydrolase
MKRFVLFLSLVIVCAYKPFAQVTPSATAVKPFVLGQIVEINSSRLAEKRILNIYLPEGYNPSDTVRYPVIYLLDGSADEDFIHIAGLVQFATFPWVHLLPKSILVGIANIDRRRDFTFPTTIEKDKKDYPTTGKSAIFIDFLDHELQPFIQKQYKTTSSKTLIGESLGGLLATEILFKRPNMFNNYIIVSPSLWWDNQSLLRINKEVLRPGFNSPLHIFIAVGKEGAVMENDCRKLTELLQAQKSLKVKLEYLPEEDHGTIMHQAVYKAFQAKF